jgi:hypothetical protein
MRHDTAAAASAAGVEDPVGGGEWPEVVGE